MDQFTVNQLNQKGALQFLAFDAGQWLVLLQALFKLSEELRFADFPVVDDDQRRHRFHLWLRFTSGRKQAGAEKQKRQ